MEDSCFQYLYLHTCLYCKLLLILDDLEGDILLLLVVESFEHLTERATTQHSHDLILVAYRVTHIHFRITLAIRKIRQTTHSSCTHIV